MIGFIELHDVESSVVIGISVESIVAIRDNRTDPYIKGKKYWQWTNIDCVNHKDENKTNNFVFVNTDGSIDYEKSNLEWCTYKYNTNYGNAQDRRVVTMFEKYNKWPNSRAIIQFTKDNSFVKEYVSAAAAEEENGFNRKGIGMCASGKLKTYKGFVWRYK